MKGVYGKKTQAILSVCAALIMLCAAIVVPALYGPDRDDDVRPEFETLTQNEFLNDVSPFTEIHLVSDRPTAKGVSAY
jgi:hypothetical protein